MYSFKKETTAGGSSAGDTSLGADADHLARQVREASERQLLDALSDPALERLVSALIGLYAKKAEARGEIFPLRPSEPSNATCVLMATSGLLKGADLELFELGMWQSWSGMK